MKRLFINLLVYLFINCYQLNSQVNYSVDKWKEYIEEIASETEDETQIESLYADLSYLSEHPLELNSATEEQLKRLTFLSDLQIQELLSYRLRYGKMVTLYELKNIQSLDWETISLLLPFVYISETMVDKRSITVKNMLKYGSNSLHINYNQCFQQKKGYCSYPDSILQRYPNRQYLGEPFYHSIRYSYAFEDRIQLSIVAEKDAGEPFWNQYHKGYDYYSANIFLKDMNKWLKSLSIGDYKVSFGQGLIISHDFSPSKNVLVSQMERRTNGFRRHFSTNENDFLRGIATTIHIGKFDISMFYSYRKLDASVDSSRVSSFKADGLHRLVRDWEKLRTVSMQTYGGNIRYATSNLCVGVTALSYSFNNVTIDPDLKPYNLFYFRGNKNWNMGVDYLLKNRWIKFYGETALSENKSIATLNAFQLTPVSYFSLLCLYRYYDKSYQAFYGNAFSQSSTIQNEQGLYIGMQWTPFAHWKLSAYIDLFKYPWLKYGIDHPSTGKEYMCQLDYVLNTYLSAYIRYKYKQKEDTYQQRLRMQIMYACSPTLSFRTSIEGILYEEQQRSYGWMVSQSMSWKPVRLPIQTHISVAGFHTDDYQTRLYAYEKSILYTFNSTSFYGKGIRFAFTFQWDILKQLSLSTKLGHTCYMDREKIGSDLEEIDGNNKTDLYMLLRWKF